MIGTGVQVTFCHNKMPIYINETITDQNIRCADLLEGIFLCNHDWCNFFKINFYATTVVAFFSKEKFLHHRKILAQNFELTSRQLTSLEISPGCFYLCHKNSQTKILLIISLLQKHHKN